ncbi:MAG: hypothetical protein H7836_08235, partial [Magnetococcus sp. YQC-3]
MNNIIELINKIDNCVKYNNWDNSFWLDKSKNIIISFYKTLSPVIFLDNITIIKEIYYTNPLFLELAINYL